MKRLPEGWRNITLLIMTTFFFVSFFGIFLCTTFSHSGMEKVLTDRSMNNGSAMMCTMVSDAQCTMSIVDHLHRWDTVFAADAHFVSYQVIAFFFLILFLAFIDVWRSISRYFYRYLIQYRHTNPYISLYNFLRLLFAQGILHPKIYE